MTVAAPSDAAVGVLRVADAMLWRPKTWPEDLTVAEARAALENDHVHLLLLTSGDRLFGTVTRDDVESTSSDPASPALRLARLAGRTTSPSTSLVVARRAMDAAGSRRVAVVADDGTLVGLLCLKRRRHGYCSDADVAARAAERTAAGVV